MGRKKRGLGNSEELTPKAIAKRLKAKGYGKQHLYCQLCRKQTRDENGFKCHLMSEQHILQIEKFEANQEEFINKFSGEFERGMMTLIKTNYKNQWIDINAIYNDYIRQRSHTRLNGTRWETLSDFAMYLGKNGICQVEQKAEEIWHIKYIEKDPELIKKQVESEKKQKREKDEEERLQEEIQRRIQKENSLMETPTHAPTELDLEKKHQIKFSLGGLKTSSNKDTNNTNNSSFEESENSKQITLTSDEKQTPKFIEQKSLPAPSLKRKLEIEENSISSSSLNSEPTSKKSKTDPNVWLMEGIIVKILNQKLQNGKFYKKKGIVEKILDNSSVAFVKLLEEKVKLKIDQSQLETVIPQLGKPVMVVKGHHKGKLGILQELDQTKFTAKVKLEKEATLIEAEFDDICKIEEQ